jgi:hypothetical protein
MSIHALKRKAERIAIMSKRFPKPLLLLARKTRGPRLLLSFFSIMDDLLVRNR